MSTRKKTTFKKDGTTFGNLFRLLLALLVLSVVWFTLGFNWGHNHGHDLFEYGYVRDQYLGFHYSLAITFIPAVIIGCILASMLVLGPFLLAMNALNTDARPKFYLGFLVSLIVMAGASCIPAVSAYQNHLAKGAPLFEEPPRKVTNLQPAPNPQPETRAAQPAATGITEEQAPQAVEAVEDKGNVADGGNPPFSTDGMDPAVAGAIRAQAPDQFLEKRVGKVPSKKKESAKVEPQEVCDH
jgi:hypothetical protein